MFTKKKPSKYVPGEKQLEFSLQTVNTPKYVTTEVDNELKNHNHFSISYGK